MIYDIFYVSKTSINADNWKKFHSKYPSSQKIENLNSFDDIRKKSFTKFFWVVWDDLIIEDNFNFDYRVSEWDESYVHVWKNGNYFDGISLISKQHSFTKKEFDLRFFVSNKKEIDQVASIPKAFDIFYINTFEEYKNAIDQSTTNMFWVVWNDVEISKDFKFNFQVPYYNQHITHIFKNDCFYDGICLFSKSKPVTQREFNHRFFIDKKEIDIVASYPKKFDIFEIENYNDYLLAKEQSTTDLFYVVPNEVEPLADFNFDLYFSHHNSYDRRTNHVFKNIDVTETKYNGIMLLSKFLDISKKEIDYRYLITKREYDNVASKLKPYDIVFISYNEPNADENWNSLKEKFPRAKRVHGVKGIHNAHIAAAKISTTPMFFVVDGDAKIVDSFNFDLLLHKYDRDIVHIWHSKNPINDLEYGYGGVKLLPKDLVLSMNTNTVDMTTTISDKIRIVPDVSNYTMFNTDPFNTWKSAFRECVKLSSKAIDRNYHQETEARLNIWCTVGADRTYGKYAIRGALEGKLYGEENISNPDNLRRINDFEWLIEKFNFTTD
jgi:hypothetical protein